MRRVGGMLSDDGAVGLLRHNKAKQIFTHLIMGVWLKLDGGVFGCSCVCIFGNDWLSLGPLSRQSGKRCERSPKRKHNF